MKATGEIVQVLTLKNVPISRHHKQKQIEIDPLELGPSAPRGDLLRQRGRYK